MTVLLWIVVALLATLYLIGAPASIKRAKDTAQAVGFVFGSLINLFILGVVVTAAITYGSAT